MHRKINRHFFMHTIFGLKSLPPARSSPTNKYLFWAVLLVRCFITPETPSTKSSRKLKSNTLMANCSLCLINLWRYSSEPDTKINLQFHQVLTNTAFRENSRDLFPWIQCSFDYDRHLEVIKLLTIPVLHL
jgi:hypothetical protein